MNWPGIKAVVFRQIEVNLPVAVVEDAVSRHGIQSWFVYAHRRRRERRHVWWPSLWLAPRLPSSARILETGCGLGLNLLWFGQHGFKELYGSDIDERAIAAGRELFADMGLNARLWVDDGLSPRCIALQRFDAILALNWTYHLEQFDLGRFLHHYHTYLATGGYLVIDVIDSSYSTTPNNQYLTSDWGKPEPLRLPTEYKKRYSEAEVRQSAGRCGFKVIRSELCRKYMTAPRRVYILASLPARTLRS